MKPHLIVYSAEGPEALLPPLDFGPRSVVASVMLRVVWDDPWASAPVAVALEVASDDDNGADVVTVRLHADGTTSAE